MTFSERTTYNLRRWHSLTGILPIGLFLLFHLFINSKSLQGQQSYEAAATGIASLPYVVVLELLVIGVPILFHMVLGVVIATSAQWGVRTYRYERGWAYVVQRVTGLFLVLFIIYHVWTTRLATGPGTDLFELMRKSLANPGIFVFYVLGVTAAAYHLGNGLFGFAIHWGIAVTRPAQRRAAMSGTLVFVVLTLVSINALLGFEGMGVRLFERTGETTATAAAPEVGR